MKRLVPGLALACMVATTAPAIAACFSPAEKTAFDIAGLKSQLMVTSLACNARSRYNVFVKRFLPQLQSGERNLTSYFGAHYGHTAQAAHDSYITSLANTQSEQGVQLGTSFCQHTLILFDEVQALRKASELAELAAGVSARQPVPVTSCETAARMFETADNGTAHHP